ncbi:MAG: hypothetical protein NWE81_03705 [Candidatus Bathyarchaeota archaeon]|jgi:UDP:flavonoid glycosyltransferase YjiC (YdhE family)|nr:hypothetical protein [Candidatus Bathyarchaeota archaeon]
MRVQFAPCGVGLGHAGRCVPIAKGLKRRDRKTEIYFSTYNDALSYARIEGFPTVEVPSVDFKVKPDGTVDFKRTAMNPGPFAATFDLLEQINKELEVMGKYEPDVVVSDSRASPILAGRMRRIPTICILNQFQIIIPRRTHYLRLAKLADAITLAILGRIWTTSERVMIPDFPHPYTISRDNLRIPRAYQKKIQLIGPILPVRPDGLPSKKELRRKLGLSDDRPVIFAPISGPLKERSYLLSTLQRIFTRIQDDCQIVMSLGYPESDSTPVNCGNLTVFRWIPNRFEYMQACDVLVSRAGHGTILQAMCFGKPIILIPTPSHTEQLNNARKAVNLGVASIIEQDKLSREALQSAMAKAGKDRNLSERILEMQQEISNIDGLETAIEITSQVIDGSL